MSSVVLVDWLGRGGIAQNAEAWAIELGAAGHDVAVVTRPDRELGSGVVPVIAAPAARGRLAAHRSVARAAAREIRARRPEVVVIQNYVLPPLEGPVYAAARAVGSRTVVVVHDHRLHTWKAGTRAGLARRLADADAVVVHSDYVADGVESYAPGVTIEQVPLPAPVGMLRHQPEPPALDPGPASWAGHFGVLHRAYKGANVVEALAGNGVEGWGFLAVGVGAPTDAPGLRAIPGYASPGALVGAVSATDVTLAPYELATQSAVVELGHLLGSVPVASAVGGIPEQIEHGVDGLLVPAGAPVDAWRDALTSLDDTDVRKAMAVAGTARAWREHEEFVRRITELVA